MSLSTMKISTQISAKGLSRFSSKPTTSQITETLKLLYDFYVKIPDDFADLIKGIPTYSQLIAWREQYILDHTPKENTSTNTLNKIRKHNMKYISGFLNSNNYKNYYHRQVLERY